MNGLSRKKFLISRSAGWLNTKKEELETWLKKRTQEEKKIL